MIYQQKYLQVKLLLGNVCNYELKGIYRPQAYLYDGSGKYCTECQMTITKQPIQPKESLMVNAVLLAPHGYGDQLVVGSLLTLQNGLDVEAKAIVTEIIGYSQ